MNSAAEALELLDYKRRVLELYAAIRNSEDPPAAWDLWRRTRDDLFANHPQSAIPVSERRAFAGLQYFDYDPKARVLAEVSDEPPEHLEIGASGGGSYGFTRFATVHFALFDTEVELALWWLDGYGSGLFLPFRDGTSGRETYGAGRYLLDTVKGADLGTRDNKLVLDFNFAYNPSCAYDPKWVCPLAPPANRTAIEIRAGERSFG